MNDGTLYQIIYNVTTIGHRSALKKVSKIYFAWSAVKSSEMTMTFNSN